MAANYLHKPGTPGGHCPSPCQHDECIEDRHDAQQICKICGRPIGYEIGFYFVFMPDGSDGWYEHAEYEECVRLKEGVADE